MRAHRIALIPGDGVGTEVLDTAWTVLKAAASRQHFTLEGELFPWSCRYFEQHGRMMPEDGLSQLSQFDAIFRTGEGYFLISVFAGLLSRCFGRAGHRVSDL